MTIRIDGTNSAANPGITGSDTDTGLQFGTDEVNIVTGGSTRATVDSSGRLLVGTSSALDTESVVPRIQSADAGNQAGFGAFRYSEDTPGPILHFFKSRGASVGTNTIVSNADVLGEIRFAGADGTNEIIGAKITAVVDGTPGTNDMPGRLIFFTTADGASSPTERMRITASGDVTTTGANTFNRTNAGFTARNGDSVSITRASGTPLEINRQGNDGTIVAFYESNSAEGSITISGTTVSYNGAHLSRWSQLPGGVERTEILRGSVLSNIDEMCEWSYDAEPEVLWAEGDELPEGVSVGDVKTPAKEAGAENNEQLNRMKVSDVEGDKNVAGVFQAWDDDDDTYTNDFYCAMTGDFVIRIAQGVTVERGDLLMSAGDGTAKPQDDDIIRSKTIAKVTSTNVSCTYDDGSYCVPCVLMAC